MFGIGSGHVSPYYNCDDVDDPLASIIICPKCAILEPAAVAFERGSFCK